MSPKAVAVVTSQMCKRFQEQENQQDATRRAAPDTQRRGTQVCSAVYFRLVLLLCISVQGR